MTNAELTFIVVEDTINYQTEVLNQLGKAGFDPANHFGIAATYDDAKELLQKHATDLDVVFLDLNIPRSEQDPKPEDKHGTALLDIIHQDLNKRPSVDIRVIIVSGQDLAANEAAKNLMLAHYSPTLVGVAEKAAITEMLKANLKRLRRDPMVANLRRLGIDIVTQWEALTDTSKPTLDRLSAGRAIAIRIAQNEIDYREGQERSHPEFDDKLGWIGAHIMKRFDKPQDSNKQHVSTGLIRSKGGWGSFLWRGILMEHFRTIDNYWNAYKHRGERPYRNPTQDPDEWRVSDHLVERGNRGEIAVKIVELCVRDLLEWYLPWHEQVLAPE
jgi:CheY-like chemotaxis protein